MTNPTPYEANNGQPPEYFAEQLFAELPEWMQARLPLDDEFRRVALSVNTIIARLSQIQRDDGEIANHAVGYDQLKPEVTPGGIGAIRPWEDMARYVIKDSVFYNNSWYVCKKEHTADNTNRPDVDVPDPSTSTEGTYWVLLHDFSALFTDVINQTEQLKNQTQQIKDDAVTETTQIADQARTDTQAIADKAVADTTQIYDDTVQIKNETAGLLDTKIDKVGGDTGAARIPAGTEAQKPDTTAEAQALIRLSQELGWIGFNPFTNEWTSLGGGLVKPKKPLTTDYPYTIGKGEFLLVDVSDGVSKVVNVPNDWSVGDGFFIALTGWSGDPSVTVRIAVDANQLWDHPEYPMGANLAIGGNQMGALQIVPGNKLKIAQAVGESQRVVKRGETLVYDTPVAFGAISFLEEITEHKFDAVRIESSATATPGFGNKAGASSVTLSVNTFLNATLIPILDRESAGNYIVLSLQNITGVGATLYSSASNWTGELRKIVGIKY